MGVFRIWLETFGKCSPKLLTLGNWRLAASELKRSKMPAFRTKIDRNLKASEWLAGDAVLIAPVSG